MRWWVTLREYEQLYTIQVHVGKSCTSLQLQFVSFLRWLDALSSECCIRHLESAVLGRRNRQHCHEGAFISYKLFDKSNVCKILKIPEISAYPLLLMVGLHQRV